jgi:adenylate cyclase
MTRRTQLKLNQLRVIIGAWIIVAFFITLYDHFLLRTNISLGPSPEYSFWLSAIRTMLQALVGGLLGGSLLVFYINVKYQDKPYAYTILAVTLFFIMVVLVISLIAAMVLIPLRTGEPFYAPASRTAFQEFIRDPYPIKSAIVWYFIVIITQLMLQVNSKFGQAEFWNIIRGKYHKPKEENRVFMFLDLNASTTIAEQLGDEKYHSLLKEFFSDLTNPILDNKGSIYQYVGDEVVIAWSFHDGIKNAHCIRCFFDMKAYIHKQEGKYMERYGLVPSFKAGLHCGRVIAGEVGIIKRDITYSGDVLNTTSRILDKCGELQEEIIVSSDLLKKLDFTAMFQSRPLGSIKLKGREKEVQLNALSA